MDLGQIKAHQNQSNYSKRPHLEKRKGESDLLLEACTIKCCDLVSGK